MIVQKDIHSLGIIAGQASRTQRDTYQWLVQYQDGIWHAEYNHTRPDGRGFSEIEQEQVKAVALGTPDGLAHLVHYRVDLPDGATPIFFRRRKVAINLTDESTTPGQTVHCIGWRHGDQATYLFVFDDGSTLLTDNLQAV